MSSELEFNDLLEFEFDLYNSRMNLDMWLDDELKLQPKHLEGKILLGCNNLSMTYQKRGSNKCK